MLWVSWPMYIPSFLYNILGIYVCSECEHPLFSSKKKYEHASAWPAFTETVRPDSVVKVPEENRPKAIQVLLHPDVITSISCTLHVSYFRTSVDFFKFVFLMFTKSIPVREYQVNTWICGSHTPRGKKHIGGKFLHILTRQCSEWESVSAFQQQIYLSVERASCKLQGWNL